MGQKGSRIIDKLDRSTLCCIGVFNAILLLIVLIQVASRSLRISLPWTEEVAMFILCYLVFLGAAIGVKNRDHFFMEIILNRLPAKIRRYLTIIDNIILGLLLMIMIWSSIILFLNGLRAVFPATLISKGWLYIIMPITSVVMLAYTVINTVAEIRKGD